MREEKILPQVEKQKTKDQLCISNKNIIAYLSDLCTSPSRFVLGSFYCIVNKLFT